MSSIYKGVPSERVRGAPFDFQGAWKLGLGNFFFFFFFFNSSDGWIFFFVCLFCFVLVSLVDEVFSLKLPFCHWISGSGWFFFRCLFQQSFFFCLFVFFTPQVSEIFFSLNSGWFFFSKKLPCPFRYQMVRPNAVTFKPFLQFTLCWYFSEKHMRTTWDCSTASAMRSSMFPPVSVTCANVDETN